MVQMVVALSSWCSTVLLVVGICGHVTMASNGSRDQEGSVENPSGDGFKSSRRWPQATLGTRRTENTSDDSFKVP